MSALKFLNLKSFHPTNKANQRRLFIAQEKEKERLRREAEARKEIEMEQELYESRLLALQALHSNELQQSKDSMMKRKAELNNAADTNSQTITGEHKRKRKRSRKKKENANTENSDVSNKANGSKSIEELIKADIDVQQLRFMYNAPPGLKAALDKELEEKRKQTEGQQKTEEEGYIPKHMVPDEVKFPILKNAPVQGTYTENMKLKHKPFGITLRDVKCTRCGNYGHTNIDRECPLRDKLPVDEKKLAHQDPLFMMQQKEEEFNQSSSITSLSHSTKEEEDPEKALEKMTEKEKKDLIKKYKKLKKAEKKEKKRQKKEKRDEKRKRHDTESELSEEETIKKRGRHEDSREYRDRYRDRHHHHHSRNHEKEESWHGYHRE
jgi:CBF1 interacting corepressor